MAELIAILLVVLTPLVILASGYFVEVILPEWIEGVKRLWER
jgi:hypothetical protein